MFNRFACFWPKGYQLGSLGKSHQNGDYLNQAMRKNCLPAGIELAAFGLPQNDIFYYSLWITIDYERINYSLWITAKQNAKQNENNEERKTI